MKLKRVKLLDTEGTPDGYAPTVQGGRMVLLPPTGSTSGGVSVVLLESGQTVEQYQTENGVTVPAGTLIARKA